MPTRRFKPSGRNIKESERNTTLVKVRCAPELALKVRALAADKGLTLAQILEAGVTSLSGEQS